MTRWDKSTGYEARELALACADVSLPRGRGRAVGAPHFNADRVWADV
jgi:hypothetical protein